MEQPVLVILRAELDLARAEYEDAKESFWRVSGERARPAENRQVVAAAREQTHAMIKYTKALRRLNEFLIQGTVPEDIHQRMSTGRQV